MNVKKAIIVAILGVVAIPAVASANARHNDDRGSSSKNQVFATQIDSQTQDQLASTEITSQAAAENAAHHVVAAKTHPFFKFLFGK
ncbi:MAG: hypothetical protein WB995_16465 [Candidatus Acidiferrales bacterium]